MSIDVFPPIEKNDDMDFFHEFNLDSKNILSYFTAVTKGDSIVHYQETSPGVFTLIELDKDGKVTMIENVTDIDFENFNPIFRIDYSTVSIKPYKCQNAVYKIKGHNYLFRHNKYVGQKVPKDESNSGYTGLPSLLNDSIDIYEVNYKLGVYTAGYPLADYTIRNRIMELTEVKIPTRPYGTGQYIAPTKRILDDALDAMGLSEKINTFNQAQANLLVEKRREQGVNTDDTPF